MSNILLVLQFLPSVLRAVIAIENTIVLDAGQDKKKLFLDILQDAVVALSGAIPDNKTISLVGTLIDSTVKALKVLGVFKSSVPESTVVIIKAS